MSDRKQKNSRNRLLFLFVWDKNTFSHTRLVDFLQLISDTLNTSRNKYELMKMQSNIKIFLGFISIIKIIFIALKYKTNSKTIQYKIFFSLLDNSSKVQFYIWFIILSWKIGFVNINKSLILIFHPNLLYFHVTTIQWISYSWFLIAGPILKTT